ncbi:MAG: hypothetical protein ACYC7J_17450 [Syntrophales bacterium]
MGEMGTKKRVKPAGFLNWKTVGVSPSSMKVALFWVNKTKDAAFYLCGPPPMMEFALKELGVLQVDQSAVAQDSFTRQ